MGRPRPRPIASKVKLKIGGFEWVGIKELNSLYVEGKTEVFSVVSVPFVVNKDYQFKQVSDSHYVSK